MKLVMIKWRDAIYNTNWVQQHQIDSWDEMSSTEMISVGWLVKQTKNYIIIANTHREDDWDVGEQWCGVHKIPKAWIIERLDIPQSKRSA